MFELNEKWYKSVASMEWNIETYMIVQGKIKIIIQCVVKANSTKISQIQGASSTCINF